MNDKTEKGIKLVKRDKPPFKGVLNVLPTIIFSNQKVDIFYYLYMILIMNSNEYLEKLFDLQEWLDNNHILFDLNIGSETNKIEILYDHT